MKEADFMMACLKPSTKHRTFTHLNAYQRGQIQVLHQERRSSREIARQIGCSHQTVLNELCLGTTTQIGPNHRRFQAYFLETGQAVYERNRGHCGRRFKLLRISLPMPRRRSCPQTNGLRMRSVAQPKGIRSGKTRSGSVRGRYTIILIADF